MKFLICTFAFALTLSGCCTPQPGSVNNDIVRAQTVHDIYFELQANPEKVNPPWPDYWFPEDATESDKKELVQRAAELAQ